MVLLGPLERLLRSPNSSLIIRRIYSNRALLTKSSVSHFCTILCELYEGIFVTVNLRLVYGQSNLTGQFLRNSSKSNMNLYDCLNFLSNQPYYLYLPDFLSVLKKIFIVSALLGDMDWTKEAIILQRNLALGDAKHRRLVQNLYEDVRQGNFQFAIILTP